MVRKFFALLKVRISFLVGLLILGMRLAKQGKSTNILILFPSKHSAYMRASLSSFCNTTGQKV